MTKLEWKKALSLAFISQTGLGVCVCEDAVLTLSKTVASDPQLTAFIRNGKPLPAKTLFHFPVLSWK